MTKTKWIKSVVPGMNTTFATKKANLQIWICPKCEWVTVSDDCPHRMDYCKCGATGVDHEEHYTRTHGQPIFLVYIDRRNPKGIKFTKMWKAARNR